MAACVNPTLTRARGWGITDTGRRRPSNEDAFWTDDATGLYVVADGMGGHAAGEVASWEAIDSIRGMAHEPRAEPTMEQMRRRMEAAVQCAAYSVFALSEIDPDKAGMGTTVTALRIAGSHAVVAHVGDSRVYRVRKGHAERMTEDHTLVAFQVKNGIISLAEAPFSPHRNVITRSVGTQPYVEVDTEIVALEPGDQFLLCTDGLHHYLRDEDLASIVAHGGERALRLFVQLANARGGADNITAVLVEIDC